MSNRTASFKIEKKPLLVLLKKMAITLGGKVSSNHYRLFEMTLTDGKVTFNMPGAQFYAECETQGTCKCVAELGHFYDIVKNDRKQEITVAMEPAFVGINGLKIKANSSYFENDRILRSIDLPMNYTEADLVRLSKHNYTWEELAFNKITGEVSGANISYIRNIKAAFKKLKLYGVTLEDIEQLTHKRLYKE